MTKNIVVIGAGISGMATAYLLCEKKYHVSIYAREFSPNITSDRAAAFWFPYHIRNDKRGINWCRMSYQHYKQLAENPETGISMRILKKVIRTGIEEEEPVWVDFMPEGTLRKMNADELQPGYAKGYAAIVPLIETQIFLPWLRKQLENSGVHFYKKDVQSFDEIKNEFDIVINCAALGSRKLCNDESLVPVRGQVALLAPKNGMDIFLDNEKPLYVVPRKDAIIVGGTYEEGIDSETTEPATIEKLLKNAYEVFEDLKQQQVMGSWAGLRPYRADVRVEKEPGTNIIHNYGHGGSGFTLSFGCAREVVSLIEEDLKRLIC